MFSCFLCFQEYRLGLNHSQKDPGSGKNSSRIQGVEKYRIRIRNTALVEGALTIMDNTGTVMILKKFLSLDCHASSPSALVSRRHQQPLSQQE
jgi:hypothetical protein